MKKITFTILALILISVGCSSSKITNTWKAENSTTKNFKKFLIVCISRQADSSVAFKMENHFADDLRGRGFSALSSLQLYGSNAYDTAAEKTRLEELKHSGVDAIITIVLLNVQKEINYTGGNINFREGYPYNNFQMYYEALNRRVLDPAYYESSTSYFWESNFYDINGKLIYSVQSTTFNPASTEKMAHKYGKMIVKNMVENKIM
jgi:hypothetical protein